MSPFSSAFRKPRKNLAGHLTEVNGIRRHHVVIDLTAPTAQAALESLIKLPALSSKVKTATIRAESLFGCITLQRSHVERCLDALATLPKLATVSIELNYHVMNFPVSAIIKLLAGTNSIKKLQLKHFHFMGSREEMEELEQVASSCTCLESLTLDFVNGSKLVRTLVRNLPSLKDLRVISSALNLPPKELLRLKLKQLHLEDIPNLDDKFCIQLAEALTLNTSLRNFAIFSTMVSDASAKAFCSMLLVNNTLNKVTLHMDSEMLPIYVAAVIEANKALEKIDIRITDHVTRACLQLAAALKHNETLQTLRLRLEIELESLPKQCIAAFGEVLSETNTALGSLSFDDGTLRYPLGPDMKLQLQLNQSGVRKLLQHDVPATLEEQVETLFQTLPKKDDNLSATFYLLQNSPELIHAALAHEESPEHDSPTKPANGIRHKNDRSASKDKDKDHPLGWRIPLPAMLLKRHKSQPVSHDMARSA